MTIPQENIPQVNQDTQKQSDKDFNFVQMRKRLEAESQAKAQAEQRARELELELQRLKQPKYDDEDDEPYVDHKKLEKKLSLFEQNIEKKIQETAEQKARALLEQERQQAYLRENADFENIMNVQVLEKFAQSHPHLAKTILNMPDGFERNKLVYETIKAMKLDRPQEKSDVQSKIDANRRSPYYQPSGIGSAPYGQNGDFSQQGQKTAYENMMALKARLGGR